MDEDDWAALNEKDDRKTLRVPTAVQGTLKYGDSDADVMVWNMSSEGLMVETSAELAIGDSIQIELGETGSLRGSVAWVRDGYIGVALG